MFKKALCVAASVALLGCSGQEVKTALKAADAARDVGCYATSEEFRAEIRDGQTFKTNLCGDGIVAPDVSE